MGREDLPDRIQDAIDGCAMIMVGAMKFAYSCTIILEAVGKKHVADMSDGELDAMTFTTMGTTITDKIEDVSRLMPVFSAQASRAIDELSGSPVKWQDLRERIEQISYLKEELRKIEDEEEEKTLPVIADLEDWLREQAEKWNDKENDE